eukprot:gnl/MRDRNA2_/MRDRNA2_103262_c0_seq1.p1 gnl/MRDRNA2_/MRDRNA2_103262_c0~~gnl/MRDRNA2_/MRDRNA2_103262_c0_seq1.p1  ORF type:complete len:269 (-),score=51.25 gnl/MRDRNA2_/MRDRNA2_103262_c0_seq1:12-818(-)
MTVVTAKRPRSHSSDAPASKRARISSTSSSPSVSEYKARLKAQGKYEDCKPGTNSMDGCLKDPPTLPPVVKVLPKKLGIPTRGKDGSYVFKDHPEFKPNLSPKEVLQLGSFGGTYYRDIQSAVTGKAYKGQNVVREFPKDWLKNVNIAKSICSSTYDKSVNKYNVACGGSLGQWECSGWISELDPYGWFQWYCRFFLGRRSTDDDRQIDRWLKGHGPSGRWRIRLCKDIVKAKGKIDDPKVSPVLRQVCQHWGYKPTKEDLELHKKKR